MLLIDGSRELHQPDQPALPSSRGVR
jgi:hypothetical protein